MFEENKVVVKWEYWPRSQSGEQGDPATQRKIYWNLCQAISAIEQLKREYSSDLRYATIEIRVA